LAPSRADAVKVGRCGERATHANIGRPHLDGGEHDGTLERTSVARMRAD